MRRARRSRRRRRAGQRVREGRRAAVAVLAAAQASSPASRPVGRRRAVPGFDQRADRWGGSVTAGEACARYPAVTCEPASACSRDGPRGCRSRLDAHRGSRAAGLDGLRRMLRVRRRLLWLNESIEARPAWQEALIVAVAVAITITCVGIADGRHFGEAARFGIACGLGSAIGSRIGRPLRARRRARRLESN